MKSFKDLKVWEASHALAIQVYRATKGFPTEELYGLTSQLRRAAASVPTNIAEGCGRGSDADLGRFIQIAMGSASETEYLLMLAHELGFLRNGELAAMSEQVIQVKRMLTALLKKLNAER